AKDHARLAAAAYRARLDAKADDHDARFGLTDCLVLTGEFAAAEESLQARPKALPPEQETAFKRKAAQTLLFWADSKKADPKAAAERLALLEKALANDPDNPDGYGRLMELTKLQSPEGEKARELFRRLAADAKSSALAHLFLGIDAYQQDNAKEARHHWEKAFALSNGAPLVANNLAWVLAHSEPVDLPRALKMIDNAVAKVPDEPRFRGTRGHILVKLNRPKEALPELEAAIPAYADDP